jgi:hypothetical protein
MYENSVKGAGNQVMGYGYWVLGTRYRVIGAGADILWIIVPCR